MNDMSWVRLSLECAWHVWIKRPFKGDFYRKKSQKAILKEINGRIVLPLCLKNGGAYFLVFFFLLSGRWEPEDSFSTSYGRISLLIASQGLCSAPRRCADHPRADLWLWCGFSHLKMSGYDQLGKPVLHWWECLTSDWQRTLFKWWKII